MFDVMLIANSLVEFKYLTLRNAEESLKTVINDHYKLRRNINDRKEIP